MIKYLGSKRTLVPRISALARELPVRRACDLFAGTTRVGQALRAAGVEVHSNDLASYSEALGYAYVVAGARERAAASCVLDELAALPGRRGYVTETFCERARYFRPRNGERIDAIRDAVERYDLDPVVRGLVLTALLEAADRVDSTTGLQMAYLKAWAPRAERDLELRVPHAVAGPRGSVSRLDANLLAPRLDVDLVYLDPPYNQHSYFSNYHVWETLVRWDAPEPYGVAMKRSDCRTTKSPYNSKVRAAAALEDLLVALEVPWVIASVSDEGFHDPGRLAELLGARRYVAAVEVPFKRYVGAQIGIHDPRGAKVGTVSHLRNRELLFVAGPDRARVEAAARGGTAAA